MNSAYNIIKLEQQELLNKYNICKDKLIKKDLYSQIMVLDKKLEELKNGRV